MCFHQVKQEEAKPVSQSKAYNGNMHFISAFYTVYFLFHKNQIALLKLQKIPLDLTVTLFTNYDMQDSLDFFHCMINHKQTYPMLSTSSRRETDFP